MINMMRKLICALMCIVILAGCSNKEKPKQYVAELSNPYVNTLPTFNKAILGLSILQYSFKYTEPI